MWSVMFLHCIIPMNSSRKDLRFKPRWRTLLLQGSEKQHTIWFNSSNYAQSLFLQLSKMKLEKLKSRSKTFWRPNPSRSVSRSSSPPRLLSLKRQWIPLSKLLMPQPIRLRMKLMLSYQPLKRWSLSSQVRWQQWRKLLSSTTMTFCNIFRPHSSRTTKPIAELVFTSMIYE